MGGALAHVGRPEIGVSSPPSFGAVFLREDALNRRNSIPPQAGSGASPVKGGFGSRKRNLFHSGGISYGLPEKNATN